MMDYTKYFATRPTQLFTPQWAPIPNTDQVPNSAGGFTWALDKWARLDRFLVLGSEGGTYYVGEPQLTRENASAVLECLQEDGVRTVARATAMSLTGRAAKNDPALFVLAIAAGLGNEETRAAVWAALPKVARTGTHLFHWLQYLKAFRGWGRGVRRAVSAWYTEKEPNQLAHQVLKYKSRDGWSHRDALRLAHPRAPTPMHEAVFRYATHGEATTELFTAVEALKRQAPREAAETILRFNLTREMVPTHLLRHPDVWAALLHRMPLTAMVRNLGTMTKVGLLRPMSEARRTVVARLGDRAALKAARVHPVAILAALKTYAQGHGMKGKNSWRPVAEVVDALDQAFYLAFAETPATGKRVMLALDVSASMMTRVLGMEYLTCREASAAMALVTAATEPQHMFTAFTAGSYGARFTRMPSGLSTLYISPRQRLDDVVQRISALDFGGTNCALPMLEAQKHRWPIELFVVYTDNETWAGEIHPAQALRQYRQRMGIDAKLVVVGMASNGFTIADPNDPGMLDVVGFDAAVPEVLAGFAA